MIEMYKKVNEKKESFVHINNDLHMNVKEKFDDDYYLI